jgi:hypothetical protein
VPLDQIPYSVAQRVEVVKVASSTLGGLGVVCGLTN